MALNYLTVQDMLFLNLQTTKSPQPFDYALLEEATFYQYGSGTSTDIVGQAARFLTGFVRKAPFSRGNAACAFAGTLAFLEANGKTLRLNDEDAAVWMQAVLSEPSEARQAIEARLLEYETEEAYGVPDFHEICLAILKRFPATVSALVETDSAIAAS